MRKNLPAVLSVKRLIFLQGRRWGVCLRLWHANCTALKSIDVELEIRAKWKPRKAWLTTERDWLRAHHSRCQRGDYCLEYQRRLAQFRSRAAAYKKAKTKYYWLKKQYRAMTEE